jgi:hypothetical protein
MQGNLFGDQVLNQLKSDWQDVIEHDGGHCPVCNRWGKIYGRNINRTMTISLIWLASAETDQEGWVDVPTKAPRWLVRSNQLPTLKWWGLVERKPNDKDSTNKHSGMWKVTERGARFVDGKIAVPKRAFTYNDEVLGFEDNLVLIHECFRNQFDYEEIMRIRYTNLEL